MANPRDGIDFQLLPFQEGQPYQQVASIVTPYVTWQDPTAAHLPEATDIYRTFLAVEFAANLIRYAHANHDGAGFMKWCHDFAAALDETAAISRAAADPVIPNGMSGSLSGYITLYSGQARAESIVRNGIVIQPEELQFGEQGVIGSPEGIVHSIVGLRRPKKDKNQWQYKLVTSIHPCI